MEVEKTKEFWKYGINPIVGFRIKDNIFVSVKEKRKKTRWSMKD